jgi:hypothetical protein
MTVGVIKNFYLVYDVPFLVEMHISSLQSNCCGLFVQEAYEHSYYISHVG